MSERDHFLGGLLGGLTPMPVTILVVGPASPCWESIDCIMFFTRFISTFTGVKSSSRSSISTDIVEAGRVLFL